MIHSGAVIAAGISQGKVNSFRKMFDLKVSLITLCPQGLYFNKITEMQH